MTFLLKTEYMMLLYKYAGTELWFRNNNLSSTSNDFVCI